MTLSSTFRWVAIGKLKLKNEKRSPAGAPTVTLTELIDALRVLEGTPEGLRSYQNNNRRMWCSPVRECNDYYHLLFQTGDKTVSDMAYIDFDTGDSRDGGKTDSEGGHFCAHVLIKKQADVVGRHLILVEKVPGINFTTLEAYLKWVLAMPANRKKVDENGTEKEYRATADLAGFQSKTVQEAMTTGTVMDLQFVGHEVQDGGVDEDPLVRETLSEVKWTIKRTLDGESAHNLVRRGIDYLRGWDAVEQNSRQLLVRIKAEDGQIRTIPISPEAEEAEAAANEVLQSAVILNEFMNGFEIPLTQRHDDLREDVIQKMRNIGHGAGGV